MLVRAIWSDSKCSILTSDFPSGFPGKFLQKKPGPDNEEHTRTEEYQQIVVGLF